MTVYAEIEDVLTVRERQRLCREMGALRLRLLPDGETIQGLFRHPNNRYLTRWETVSTVSAAKEA